LCFKQLLIESFKESAMGIKIDSQRGQPMGNAYIESTHRAFEIFVTRVFRIWWSVDSIFQFSPLHKEFSKCTRVFHQLTDKVIAEKRSNQDAKRQKTFIDEIFNANGSSWTDKEIRDEISSMIAAGADTTSHSLSFTILLLAMFPDVQEKVYREVQEIGDAQLSMETCSKMTYMGQVIKESLRLFAPSTIIGRYTTGNVTIKTNNLTIPKNVFVIIGMSMLHRQREIWGDDANQFNPENFSKENCAKRKAGSFVAFSNGLRNCVGIKFADLSMKVILFKLLQAYRLETDEKFDDIKCEFRLLMRKVGGWKVKLYPR